MTVVVGYRPGVGGEAGLALATELCRSLRRDLAVVIALPRPWSVPSMAKVDAEFAAYAQRLGDDAESSARAALERHPVPTAVTVHRVAERSVSAALATATRRLGATMLVMGTRRQTGGHITLGSTTGRMVHSSEIPLALAPPGHEVAPDRPGIAGITCAYSATSEGDQAVARAAEMAADAGVRLRVASFGVAPTDMYPPEVGLGAERGVLAAWREQAGVALARLVSSGVVDADTETVVATGTDYAAALAAVDWPAGEVLALGTTPRSGVKRVFLGSTATRILGGATVPTIVLPG
ncbi:universal stress protein [Williamsia herbipolensis]|uniref:Universal stress protein n=1 Tax=Williamsia herbipolensis TaxID=1603258 RepID=A0AAU4K6D5_9NOCA|nr:universal stress protein [Williamsia herbipolensis]